MSPSREPAARHQAREAALQMLYQWEIARLPIDEVIETFWVGPGAGLPEGRHRQFASDLARGTVGRIEGIDPLIAASAEHWRLSRMAVIDRLIMRLAVYELLEMPDTPPKVVLNEALELARTFSAEDSVRFVNGVLDGVRRRLEEGVRER